MSRRLPPSSDACSGREGGDSLRVRPSISKDKDLLVSGDIFIESSGKYVIAEANRMPNYEKSTHLNSELDRET